MVFSTPWTRNSLFFTHNAIAITPLTTLRADIERSAGCFNRENLGLSRATFDCLKTLEQAASVEEMRGLMAIPGFERRLDQLIADVSVEKDYQSNIWCLYLLLVYSLYTGSPVCGDVWGELIRSTIAGPYREQAEKIIEQLYGFLDAEAVECTKHTYVIAGFEKKDEKYALELMALTRSLVTENRIGEALPYVLKLLEQHIFFFPLPIQNYCLNNPTGQIFVERFLKASERFHHQFDEHILDFLDVFLPKLNEADRNKEIYKATYKVLYTSIRSRNPYLYQDPRIKRIDSLGLRRSKEPCELQRQRLAAADAYIDAKNFSKALSTLSHVTLDEKEALWKRYERIFEWIDVGHGVKCFKDPDFEKRALSIDESCYRKLLSMVLQRSECVDESLYLIEQLLERGVVDVSALQKLHFRSPNHFLGLKNLLQRNVAGLSRKQRQILQACALEVEEPFALIDSAGEWKEYFCSSIPRHLAVVREYGLLKPAKIKKEVVRFMTEKWRRRLQQSDAAYCHEWIGAISENEQKDHLLTLMILFLQAGNRNGAVDCLVKWADDERPLPSDNAVQEVVRALQLFPVSALPLDVWFKLLSKEWDAHVTDSIIACGERLLQCKLKNHVEQLLTMASRVIRVGEVPSSLDFAEKVLIEVARHKSALTLCDRVMKPLTQLYCFYASHVEIDAAGETVLLIEIPLARQLLELKSPLLKEVLTTFVTTIGTDGVKRDRTSIEPFVNELCAHRDISNGAKALLLENAFKYQILEKPLVVIKALPKHAKRLALVFIEKWLKEKTGRITEKERKALVDLMCYHLSFITGTESMMTMSKIISMIEQREVRDSAELITSWRSHILKVLFMPRLKEPECYIEHTGSPHDRGFSFPEYKQLVEKCIEGGGEVEPLPYSCVGGGYFSSEPAGCYSLVPSIREVAYSRVDERLWNGGYNRCLIDHYGYIVRTYINDQSGHVPDAVKIELFVLTGLLIRHTRTADDRDHFGRLWKELSHAMRPIISNETKADLFPVAVVLRLLQLYGLECRVGYVKRFTPEVDTALVNTVNKSLHNALFLQLFHSNQINDIIARSARVNDKLPLMIFLSSFFTYNDEEIPTLAFSRCARLAQFLSNSDKEFFKKVVFAKDVLNLTDKAFLIKWKEQIRELQQALKT